MEGKDNRFIRVLKLENDPSQWNSSQMKKQKPSEKGTHVFVVTPAKQEWSWVSSPNPVGAQ